MRRSIEEWSVETVRESFLDIEFPDYQREPNIWNLKSKQKLIDSMLREFDIASLYFYQREDGVLECIDGRQRLNAIMSFLGENPGDSDNGFAHVLINEIEPEAESPQRKACHGANFQEISARAESGTDTSAEFIKDGFLRYQITVVTLSGANGATEFNLQFIRLNLGTLINAGEKLHAMVGGMRDLVFGALSEHPFLAMLQIPTRRYAKEVVAAQILLQVFSLDETGDFARARHFDLQRFFKEQSQIGDDDPRVDSVQATLDLLSEALSGDTEILRNRAMTVSVVLLAWKLRLYEDETQVHEYVEFLRVFWSKLQEQVKNMKEFNVDHRYPYLVEFQRHVTQAAVERPAVAGRNRILAEEFDRWRTTGHIKGDDDS